MPDPKDQIIEELAEMVAQLRVEKIELLEWLEEKSDEIGRISRSIDELFAARRVEQDELQVYRAYVKRLMEVSVN